MPKLLVVFGATGTQGGSVIDHVAGDPALSAEYAIRAVTRDPGSEAARKLRQKHRGRGGVEVEVVGGDLDRPDSLGPALAGAHTVFLVTTPAWGSDDEGNVEAESARAAAAADRAAAAGAAYIIFSTLPGVRDASGGRLARVTPFDAKARAERHIRALPGGVRSAFVCFGFFMENFHTQPFLNPQLRPDGDGGSGSGTWILSRPFPPGTKLPYLAAARDAGKFVGAVLADPDRLAGRTLLAAQAFYTPEDIAAAISRTSPSTSAGSQHQQQSVVFEQVPADEFARGMPFAPGMWLDAFAAVEQYGYFGAGAADADTDGDVAWAAGLARRGGELTTLDKFLAEKPVRLGA